MKSATAGARFSACCHPPGSSSKRPDHSEQPHLARTQFRQGRPASWGRRVYRAECVRPADGGRRGRPGQDAASRLRELAQASLLDRAVGPGGTAGSDVAARPYERSRARSPGPLPLPRARSLIAGRRASRGACGTAQPAPPDRSASPRTSAPAGPSPGAGAGIGGQRAGPRLPARRCPPGGTMQAPASRRICAASPATAPTTGLPAARHSNIFDGMNAENSGTSRSGTRQMSAAASSAGTCPDGTPGSKVTCSGRARPPGRLAAACPRPRRRTRTGPAGPPRAGQRPRPPW